MTSWLSAMILKIAIQGAFEKSTDFCALSYIDWFFRGQTIHSASFLDDSGVEKNMHILAFVFTLNAVKWFKYIQLFLQSELLQFDEPLNA